MKHIKHIVYHIPMTRVGDAVGERSFSPEEVKLLSDGLDDVLMFVWDEIDNETFNRQNTG